jgi:hypothetical protein
VLFIYELNPRLTADGGGAGGKLTLSEGLDAEVEKLSPAGVRHAAHALWTGDIQ